MVKIEAIIASTARSNLTERFCVYMLLRSDGQTLPVVTSVLARDVTVTTTRRNMTSIKGYPIVNEPEITRGLQTPLGHEASVRLRGRIAIARAIIEARLR